MNALHIVRGSAIPSLSVIRERAAEHEAELDADIIYFTIQDLAARWRLAPGTVRAIPRDRLPYGEFGRGRYRKRRRYHPRDVHAFEIAEGIAA